MKIKKKESGRSMVEMLGVLAVIGVLSIGGIAGYTLSMRRHRANQVLDVVNKYAALVYSTCQKQMALGEINDITKCSGIPLISEADVGSTSELYSSHSMLSQFQGIVQKNGVDHVKLEIRFVDNTICKTAASIVGTMGSNICTPENNWLRLFIPQN